MPPEDALASSFRDPAGFVFRRDGVLYRAIARPGLGPYDMLMSCGLYKELVAAALLVPHDEVSLERARPGYAEKVIRPAEVHFVSYPYEWSFSQLQDAALATLEIESRALHRGMTLVDASAYNIQFLRGRPVLIDPLSLRPYREGEPWTAYRQYCRHFLAPLALMSLRDVRLGQLARVHLDGIPLDLASSLLPFRSRLRPSLLLSLHLHAGSQKRYDGREIRVPRGRVSRQARLGLIDSLESGTRKLRWRPSGTEWADYYEDTNYTADAFACKLRAVEEFVAAVLPEPYGTWEGTSEHSAGPPPHPGPRSCRSTSMRAASKRTTSASGPRRTRISSPLLMDFSNPSSPSGWEGRERLSPLRAGPRGRRPRPCPYPPPRHRKQHPPRCRRPVHRARRHLLIEFVPKSDSQAKRLLVTREDILTGTPGRASSGPSENISRSAAVSL